MHVLIIEDDRLTSDFICAGFSQAGHTPRQAFTGPHGLFMLEKESFDLSIIDIMLPGMSGFELIEKLRQSGNNTPIIVLSAKNDENSKIKGLECGADDYQTKPFSITELLARANALIRRTTACTEPAELHVADLRLNILTHKVHRGNERILLQPMEYQLLEFLMRNAGRVVSKITIMEHVWEYNFDPHTNVVESRICHLRDKIDKNYDHKLLKTIRGFGYVIEE